MGSIQSTIRNGKTHPHGVNTIGEEEIALRKKEKRDSSWSWK
jgi:hypothetical protein